MQKRLVALSRFKNILKRTQRPDEHIYLMKLGRINEEDELGFAKTGLCCIQELNGLIQAPQKLDIDFKGEESNPDYVGYFMPEFELKTSELPSYRIKYERPYETLLLKITEYNPNLFLRKKRHHIKLKLILEKKHGK